MSAASAAAAERPTTGIGRMLLQRDLEIKELREKVGQLQAALCATQSDHRPSEPEPDSAMLVTIDLLQREKEELAAEVLLLRTTVVTPPVTADFGANTEACDEPAHSPPQEALLGGTETEDKLKAWVISNSSAQSTRIEQLEQALQEKTAYAEQLEQALQEKTAFMEQLEQQCQLSLAAIQERDYALVQYHAALQQRDAALAALQPTEASPLQLEELVGLRSRVINLSAELAAQLSHNDDMSGIVTQLMQRMEQLVADREQLAEQLRLLTKPHLFPAIAGANHSAEPVFDDWRESSAPPDTTNDVHRVASATPTRSPHAHDPAVQTDGNERLDQHFACSSVSEVSSTDTEHEQPVVRRGWFGWITRTVFPDPV